jgi:site-specific recombinase XerD
MSPLRLKMISTLELKNYSSCTVKSYIWHVANYAKHFNSCPSKLGPKEVESYLHYVLSKNYSSSHYRQVVCALRFLYREVLDYDWMLPHIPFPRKSRRTIPVVPTSAEVKQVIAAASTLRDRAILSTLYGTGVRLFELQALTLQDIDSRQMLVTIRKGKWDKQRHSLLPESLLELLREYYRERRPKHYLFEGRKGPISGSVIQRVCKKAGEQSQLNMPITPRILRHAFATHLYEAKENLITIQALLGHAHLVTTQFYTHVSTESLRSIRSPLDRIAE